MICNNSHAAGGGGIKNLTFCPADITIYSEWNTYNTAVIFYFSGLTKDKLGKGCIVGVFKATDHSALVYISPDGSAEVVTKGSQVTVKDAYDPSAGTVSISATQGSAQGFVFRQD